jgi:leucyl aminopeptidase (aminopeptidase T)
VARRVVEDVGVRPGDLVLIRDRVGNRAVLDELLLAVEESGGTPLPEVTPPAYLARLLAEADPLQLRHWDRRRKNWVESADRIIKLAGGAGDIYKAPPDALAAWSEATRRLARIEDERRIPSVLVALPDPDHAAALGMSLPELTAILLPAVTVSVSELCAQLDSIFPMVAGASTLTVYSGDDCVLNLQREGRPWLVDDGILDSADTGDGGHVANLPAGALYTTVLEDTAEGDLQLKRAGPAQNVRLHFEQGRVTGIQAQEGAAELEALFDAEIGESRRISHVGIGFNPRLRHPIGWVLVDEHVHGALIVAFGENRYLGGRNASSLNVDFCSVEATMRTDGRTIVNRGNLVGD